MAGNSIMIDTKMIELYNKGIIMVVKQSKITIFEKIIELYNKGIIVKQSKIAIFEKE